MLAEWTVEVKYSAIIVRKVDLEDDQTTDGGTEYKQILINEKLGIGERGQKTELTGRSALKSGRSVLDCREEAEGGGEEGEEAEGRRRKRRREEKEEEGEEGEEEEEEGGEGEGEEEGEGGGKGKGGGEKK